MQFFKVKYLKFSNFPGRIRLSKAKTKSLDKKLSLPRKIYVPTVSKIPNFSHNSFPFNSNSIIMKFFICEILKLHPEVLFHGIPLTISENGHFLVQTRHLLICNYFSQNKYPSLHFTFTSENLSN